MNMPDPVNTVNGMGQGSAGFGQGAIGSQVGQHQGPGIGIDRAATGGPNMDQTAQTPGAPAAPQAQGGATGQNATRKPSDFLGFLGGLGSVASMIPGPIGMIGGLVGGLANGIKGQNAKNSANAAANAATQSESAIAQNLVNGPDLAPLIKEEQAGMTSAVGHANTANPGKTLLDAFGGAFQNAIGGVASQRNQALESASNIYGGIGKNATDAASAVGNPWSSLGTSLPGAVGGLGSLFTGGRGGGNPPGMASGDLSAGVNNVGFQTVPQGAGDAGGLPPANIGAGFGGAQASTTKSKT